MEEFHITLKDIGAMRCLGLVSTKREGPQHRLQRWTEIGVWEREGYDRRFVCAVIGYSTNPGETVRLKTAAVGTIQRALNWGGFDSGDLLEQLRDLVEESVSTTKAAASPSLSPIVDVLARIPEADFLRCVGRGIMGNDVATAHLDYPTMIAELRKWEAEHNA